MQTPHLSTDASTFPNFNSTTTTCVILCEADNQLLFIAKENSSVPRQWGLPGGSTTRDGNASAAALRIFGELTGIFVPSNQLKSHGQRFARLNGQDSIIHFFSVSLDRKPPGKFQWISIFALNVLDSLEAQENEEENTIEGRAEAFDVVYHDRFWRRMANPALDSSSVQASTQMIFQKNEQQLIFDKNRKLIIVLFGPPQAGKATQAVHISDNLGVECESLTSVFHEESEESDVKVMANEFSAKHNKSAASALFLGLLAKKISLYTLSAGYVLYGYPGTQQECDVLLNTFSRDQDLLIPVYLNLALPQAQARAAETNSVKPKVLSMRHETYTAAHESIIQELRGRCQVLELEGTENKIALFEKISSHIQTKFDELAQMETAKLAKPLATPLQELATEKPQEAKGRRFGLGDLLLAGSGIALGLLIATVWKRSENQ